MKDNELEVFLGVMGFVGLFIFIGIAIQVVVAYFLYDGLSRIPQKYRQAEPYFAWLTLIPLAGIVFLWILLPFKIPESMKLYFADNPQLDDSTNKDFGKAMGLGTVISLTLTVVPYVAMIAWIPLLIFLILFMIQFSAMVKQLPSKESSTNQNSYNNLDAFDQLIKLKNLLDNNVITEEEYKVAKQKLL